MAPARCSRDGARELSDLSAARNDFGGGADELDAVDKCINNLHEKRRAKREAGLEGLIALLEGFLPMDSVDYRYLTILFRCRASLDAGSAREALLAYRTIGLLALTVGASGDCSREILVNTRHLPVLVKTLRTTSSDAAKVLAALDCLAAVTFAAARGLPFDADSALTIIWSLIRNTGAGTVVSTAALSLWALLLTTLGVGDLVTYQIPFRGLAELLDTDDPALLVATGEALAVCAELRLTRHASPEDMEALEIKVSDLATGNHGDYNKKLHKHRFMFQEIAAMVKRKTSDEELIQTSSSQRCVLKVSKWARLVQLNFLKRFLSKGFDKHLKDNPLFRENFNNVVLTNDATDLPTGKNKQCRFGREKQWTIDLRRDRMISWENKNMF